MSVVLDDPNEYMKNPLYKEHEFGDYTAFYVTIAICTVFGFTLFILNIFFCWCSEHQDYWLDSNTGNRWIFSVWTKTPYKQPPLDLSELKVEETTWSTEIYEDYNIPEECVELKDKPRQQQGRESEL